MSPLKDKELQVLGQISRNSLISQRELARATGVSLGLINIILKKFFKTGYLQVTQLNKRKLEYLLKPKGLLAISSRTYQYATRTIRNYQQLQQQLIALLGELDTEGYKYFSIHGGGDLRELLETLVPLKFQDSSVRLGAEHRTEKDAVVLNVTAEQIEQNFNGYVVSVLERIKFL